ncbi:MAG: hypothetical protein JSV94_06660 [Methanobacteriota archaeon]|nr:MAG: hypothetical protein JSV94_06660 [Euryarchaeota archaeon]
MAKVRKRSGKLEEFDRRKLEESIRRAGASPEVAGRISKRIEPKDEVSSEELRRKVTEELRRESSALSGAYQSTKLLKIRSSSEARNGVVRINEQLLKEYGARSGGHVTVRHKDREAKMQVEARPELDPHEIQVNKADLDKLGAREGVRLDVKFPK